jgi:AcrR family transcriptional regulator
VRSEELEEGIEGHGVSVSGWPASMFWPNGQFVKSSCVRFHGPLRMPRAKHGPRVAVRGATTVRCWPGGQMKLPRLPVRRPATRKSETSRQQVLDAALHVLATRGMLHASVQDIADEAGLSKGSVHYHFDSKEELVERVLAHACAAIEAHVRASFEAPGTPVEKVRAAVSTMWALRRDGAPEIRVMTDLFAQARQNERLRSALGDELRRARAQILDVGLRSLEAMGLKPRVSLEVIPRLVLAALDGLAIHHVVDPVSVEEEAELLRAVEVTFLALFEL